MNTEHPRYKEIREKIAGQVVPIARGYKGFEYRPIGLEMADQILSLIRERIKGKLLSEKELRGIFLVDFNLREVELLPNSPNDRNKASIKTIKQWVTLQEWRLALKILQAQLDAILKELE